MYKSGDKFIIELKDNLIDPRAVDSVAVWKVKGLKNFLIDEDKLKELGKFDEEIWIKTLDNLRERVSELKEENRRLREENKLKAEVIEKLEGEKNGREN